MLLRMALISSSFVSDLLLKTLVKYKIPTYFDFETSVDINQVNKDQIVHLLSMEDPKLIYTNAEDVLPIILESDVEDELKRSIRLFKDKILLREFFQKSEPEIYFTQLAKNELLSYTPPPNKDLVIKPEIGFLSIGIRRITRPEEWKTKAREALNEVNQSQGVFHESVLKSDRFLVEEYIEGEEYACDGFYDGNGVPVVLLVTKHLFRDEEDTRDVVYYTTAELMEKLTPKVAQVMARISEENPIRYFPFHFEFRIKDGNMHAIEVNPLRFGGFGLADLNYYAFGVNSYEYYLEQKKPEWREILPGHRGKYYGFVLGRVTPESRGKEPLHGAFKATFRKILDYAFIDHNRYPCFSRALVETESLADLEKYPVMNFSKFFK